MCDAVQLLPRWQASKGATLEHTIATALGMAVLPPPLHDPQRMCRGEIQAGVPVECCRGCQRPAGHDIEPEAVKTAQGWDCGQRVVHGGSVCDSSRVGAPLTVGVNVINPVEAA